MKTMIAPATNSTPKQIPYSIKYVLAGQNIGEFNHLDYLEEKSSVNSLIIANGYKDSVNLMEKTLAICKQFTKFANVYPNSVST